MHQLKDFVKSVNDELHYLDEKEVIELNRDWSSPNKLNSSSLVNFKKNLESELNARLIDNIEPIMLLGQALISDKHPASNIYKVSLRFSVEMSEKMGDLRHV